MPRTNPGRYVDPVRATRTKVETARLLGCGRDAVDELMDNETLTFVQVGNRRLPTVVSIEQVLGRSIEQLEAPLYTKPDRPVPATSPRRRRSAA
jgi:hypothetical protein